MFKWFKKHTKDGLEVPDPTPMEITLNAQRPLTIQEQIARFIRDPQFIEAARNNGVDTFDDADDFDNSDDEEDQFRSPYEARTLLPDGPEFVQTRLDEVKSGQVQELPFDRSERAQERLRAKPKKVETVGEKLDKLIEKISPAPAGDKK